eukprot:TRINITY_DN2411_c0_g1_i1.p1 TRINITY_DN2411_c0_g1~~TRINITY_DN2411_c0_g1_i1.p1  ORF type:complete len:377 (+),score=64.23 TRINITY_DN2411_c0_g1_i1:270-1400(+)
MAKQLLRRTALYDLHQELGGKIVPFCGWELPIQYAAMGISESHNHTRTHASLFDVSHMGQLRLHGRDRVALIEKLVVSDIAALKQGQAQLTSYTNKHGGIKDDTIITNAGDHLFIVVNAGCADKDIEHLTTHVKEAQSNGQDVSLELIDDRSLIAIQGPTAGKVLNHFVDIDLNNLPFMYGMDMNVENIPCRVTRCGYTGEDGFEISVPSEKATLLFRRLMGVPDVQPAGLAARDSLRLDASLCLYGNDIDEATTPIEAGLNWTISKRRRAEGGFIGADVILKQLKEGVQRKRVGLVLNDGIARAHAPIFVGEEKVGEVTSGGFSPSLKQAIAMGYVPPKYAKLGQVVEIQVRTRKFAATVSKMPFVPTRFYKGNL